MDDSFRGCHETQITAIKTAVSNGTFDAKFIRQLLLDEISRELNKPLEEVDVDYVNACDELLEQITCVGDALSDSHYTRNRTTLRARLHAAKRPGRHARLFRLGLAYVVIAVLLFGDSFFSNDHFEFLLSPDKEQIIVQGIEGSDMTVSHADDAPIHGTYNTADPQEALSLYGDIVMLPTWLPDGFAIQEYNIDLLDSYKTITIIFQFEGTEKHVVFTERTYYETDMARREIEQNNYGYTKTLNSEVIAYITDNYESAVASWFRDNIHCTLYGNITEKDLLKCLDSLPFEKEK